MVPLIVKRLLLMTVTLSALTVINLLRSDSAIAVSQSLSQCVTDLSTQGIFINDAIKQCAAVLQTQPSTETLGQCINNVRMQGFMTDAATLYCGQALGSHNSYQQSDSWWDRSSSNDFTACVERRMYRQRTVCVDRWGGVSERCFLSNLSGSTIRVVKTSIGVSLSDARRMCGR